MGKETYVSIDAVMTGQVLNHMIKKKGYTVGDIQKKLSLSCPHSIYRWLNGKALPSVDNLYILSTILKEHMEDLLVPKHDQAWLLHWIDNCDMGSRLRAYVRVVGAHG